MKILVGTNENCGILNGIVLGLKELGHEVKSFVKSRDNFFPEIRYDYDLTKESVAPKIFSEVPVLRGLEFRLRNTSLKRTIRRIFQKELLDFDAYIFTWGSVLPNLEDLRILRKLGKKIAFIFIGSEARYYGAFKQQYPDINITLPDDYYLKDDLNKKIKFIRTIELLADSIHALPDLSGLFIRPFHPTYVPYVLKGEPAQPRHNSRVRILHAPSNRDLKGTRLITQTVEGLKGEGLDFEFEILEKKPNSVVLEELKNSDIAIDQIYLHYPGIFATEGMAMGCAVGTKIFESGPEAIFSPPICNLDENNLKDQLRKLIQDQEYRLAFAKSGRDFVQKNNAPSWVAGKIIDGLTGNQTPHFSPTFFCEKFVLNKGTTLSDEVKSLNKEVVEKYAEKKMVPVYLDSLRKRELV
ncbi:MAG: hypothetical protein C5B52_09495 [Bacteroidetes bacterium]|nr:MAG: hypothetical protein C5B52_09495 [Bacteroidota bacterium]